MELRGLIQNALFLMSACSLPTHFFTRFLPKDGSQPLKLPEENNGWKGNACPISGWIICTAYQSSGEPTEAGPNKAKQSNKTCSSTRTVQGMKSPLQSSAILRYREGAKRDLRHHFSNQFCHYLSTWPTAFNPFVLLSLPTHNYLFVPLFSFVLKIPIGFRNKGIDPGLKKLRIVRKIGHWTITRQPGKCFDSSLVHRTCISCFTWPEVGRGHFW